MSDDVRVSDRLTILTAEPAWRFRARGSGGQGVDTTASPSGRRRGGPDG